MAKFYRNAAGEVYESWNSGLPHSPDDVAVTQKEGKEAKQEQAKQELRKLLKPGQTVYCILNHVSSSGMSRSISLAIGGKKGEIRKLDYLVATARGEHIDEKHGGLKVSGCGMDMGFHLVYSLGRMLWPNGTRKPHSTRNGAPDRDGGYALRSTWI
jgi:hypothetical protein